MPENTDPISTQAAALADRYGLLLTQGQLAELLDRSVEGLRCSLRRSQDPSFVAIRRCARRIGRRVYYPAADIARILVDGA